jgi:hypothetical protein
MGLSWRLRRFGKKSVVAMADSGHGFNLPKYGVLESVRHQAKATNGLLNSISARFGKGIVWSKSRVNYIERGAGKNALYFKLHGNQYANFLEFLSFDVDRLAAIKAAFPNDFTADIRLEEGLL